MSTDVCADADLWEGDMIGREIQGKRVVLLRVAGCVRAYEDRCAHLGVAISKGTIEDGTIVCSAHHWRYDAATGEGTNPRGVKLTAYPSHVREGRIVVDLPGDP